jgi:hypothetical protein
MVSVGEIYRCFKGACCLHHQSNLLRRGLKKFALMMEAASTFETPVNFYETTQNNIPDGTFKLAAVRTRNLTVLLVSLYWLLT